MRSLLAERPGSAILMDTSVYPEIVALTGIPLRQTINESDLGIYRDALSHPAAHAAIVLAFDGDEIDRAVKAHPAGLTSFELSARASPRHDLYHRCSHDATDSLGFRPHDFVLPTLATKTKTSRVGHPSWYNFTRKRQF